MYPTYGPELAQSRMNERRREAERYRQANRTSAAQAAEHRRTLRKIATAAIYLVAWPIRH